MFCKVCGSDEVTTEKKALRFKMLGLDKVVIRNVEQTTCDDCGHTTQSLPRYNIMIKQIRINLASSNRPLDGREFAFLRDKLGLTGVDVAKKLGVSNVSVSRWEKGHKELAPMADRLIRALTLEELNSVKLHDVLDRISYNNQDDIVLDCEDLNDVATFKHTSGFAFGSNKSRAWVISKVS